MGVSDCRDNYPLREAEERTRQYSISALSAYCLERYSASLMTGVVRFVEMYTNRVACIF